MEKDGWQVRRQASLFLSGCHPFDDDTNVYRDKGVYKPTLIGFDYVKRERTRVKLMIIIILGDVLA